MVIVGYRLAGKPPVVYSLGTKVTGNIIGYQGGNKESRHTADKVKVLDQKDITPGTGEAHPGSLGQETNHQPDYKRNPEWSEHCQ